MTRRSGGSRKTRGHIHPRASPSPRCVFPTRLFVPFLAPCLPPKILGPIRVTVINTSIPKNETAVRVNLRKLNFDSANGIAATSEPDARVIPPTQRERERERVFKYSRILEVEPNFDLLTIIVIMTMATTPGARRRIRPSINPFPRSLVRFSRADGVWT